MTRQEAKEKTINLLLGDQNINADFYAQLFNNYNYGEMTPISPVKMGNVNSRNVIVLSERAYEDLKRIREITRTTNLEVSFFLLGEEESNGIVYLDTVLSTYRPSERTSASVDESLIKAINDYKDNLESGRLENGNIPIFCHGHSHGSSSYSDNFSFGDLISYVQWNNEHPLFINRKFETMGMLLPPSGDYNFIMYENNPRYEGFYTFPKVYVQKNNGSLERLPAYQNGNYLVDTVRYGSR